MLISQLLKQRPTLAPLKVSRLTVMLTETCNLDCWMCDFRRSMMTNKRLKYKPEQLSDMLSHDIFRDSIRFLTFTGGEPFAHPEIETYVRTLRADHPKIVIYFSSNCTLVEKMIRVFNIFDDPREFGLLVSVDGIVRHDEQRGTDGSFKKTMDNLKKIRTHFPDLTITLKFTITPVNCDEIFATWRAVTGDGFAITFKMLEFNPFYTNKKSDFNAAFSFTAEQIDAIREQLGQVGDALGPETPKRRIAEISEVRESLAPDWTRRGKCTTPTNGGFLDCDLNFFTCKEYAPIANLRQTTLDELVRQDQYAKVIEAEACNTEKCTHCTSQMKHRTGAMHWLRSVLD